MSLATWSWIFLAVYVGGMIAFGIIGQRRVRSADDFATARGSYGPLYLALAFAATTASGATFIGLPGISYTAGTAAIWSSFLYPAGVYVGVLICMRLVSRVGDRFGTRSIPEFLGERYDSDAIRIAISLYSLLLFFYVAGQLVSGLVMFEQMLGMPPGWALGLTAAVLALYVVLGGAHADILTDGVQGFVMVALALGIILLFLLGYTVPGGLGGVLKNLADQDPKLVGWLNPDNPIYHSYWSLAAIVISHAPLGMLPHIGNKLWALRKGRDRARFLQLAFSFGLMLGMLGLGGLLARAVLGDALLQPGASSNQAIPALFVSILPTWLAALVGVGVLAAIMSTADGLVVSSSQIVANDLYRRTFVPRYRADIDEAEIDRRTLAISRVSTVVVMLLCTLMAWLLMDVNVALIVWMGTGGLTAAFAGPLTLGALWKGVTKAGAFAGFATGALVFTVTHLGVIDPDWFAPGWLHSAAVWLAREAPNPWSCAAMGEVASVIATVVVSKRTRPLPEARLRELFPEKPQRGG